MIEPIIINRTDSNLKQFENEDREKVNTLNSSHINDENLIPRNNAH